LDIEAIMAVEILRLQMHTKNYATDHRFKEHFAWIDSRAGEINGDMQPNGSI